MALRKPRRRDGEFSITRLFLLERGCSLLKIIMQADETRFKLLSEGPSVLAMKDLHERVSQIENR